MTDRIVQIVGGLALLGLALLTLHRLPVWQSDAAVWTDAVADGEATPRAWINHGVTAQLAGDRDAAVLDYERALTTAEATHDEHGAAIAYMNLATIAADRGQLQVARIFVRQAHADDPRVHHFDLERALLELP